MPVVAISGYSFPSRSRAELYGDDQLVNVLWRNNTYLCAPATFRAPKGMPFGEFLASIVEPWAASAPDFVAGSTGGYQVDFAAVTVDPEKSLTDNGIGHKSLLSFEA